MFAFGNSPCTNSSDGVLSNPMGGGTLAPVAKINTWLRFALESPSENTLMYRHMDF